MSFGEKLAKLRKEKGLSQEDLANELNVSRQAVSKWESNNAYPETEKIISICKIFNCSMDELIGIKESKGVKKERKIFNTFNNYFDMFIKGIKMFYRMTFMQKIKCLLEMTFYFLILLLLFVISINLCSEIISHLLYLLPYELLVILIHVFEGLYYILYIVFGTYVLVRLYKARYLDYYPDTIDTKEEVFCNNEEVIGEVKVKEEKIILRDGNNEFKLFSGIKKLWTIFLKCIAVFISFSIAIVLVTLIALMIFFFFHIKSGDIIFYIALGILGSIIFIYILLEILVKYIFNMKQNAQKLFILLIISLLIIGVSGGLFGVELSNFKFVDNIPYNTLIFKENISMKDNLVIEYLDQYNTDIIFTNNNDIVVEFYGYSENTTNVFPTEYTSNRLYEIHSYYTSYFYEGKSINDIIKEHLKYIENKEIIMSDAFQNIKIKVYINEDNYNILMDNYKKLLNFEEQFD